MSDMVLLLLKNICAASEARQARRVGPVGKGVRGVGMWASRRLVQISMPTPSSP